MLHSNIRYVTETAVAANAESSRFPPTWLFFARWSKGKKAEEFKLVGQSAFVFCYALADA